MLNKAVVEDKVFQSESSHYVESEISDRFVRERRSLPLPSSGCNLPCHRLATLREQLQPTGEQLTTNRSFAIPLRVESQDYIATFVSIRNVSQDPIAYLVSYEPDSSIASYRQSFYVEVTLLTLLNVLFMGFLYHVHRSQRLLRSQKNQLSDTNTALESEISARTEAEEHERHKSQQLTETLEKLKATQSQLVQSEKMSALGQLVAGVAHEINNPTSFIYSNVTPAQDYAASLLQMITLYQQTYPDPPPEIAQVFASLISNAIDALEQTYVDRPKQIQIATWCDRAHNAIYISIADNGSGIAPEVRDRIFDPFFTTKPVGKGTGLGLSTSYSIITHLHQGSLHCYSTPGVETEFIISIPIQLNQQQ